MVIILDSLGDHEIGNKLRGNLDINVKKMFTWYYYQPECDSVSIFYSTRQRSLYDLRGSHTLLVQVIPTSSSFCNPTRLLDIVIGFPLASSGN